MLMNLAHRGASSYAPENTLSAFCKGIELGANGIETDLRMSKDGVVYLFHDHVLDRTTDGTGEPHAYTWDELRRLDAGAWFSPRYKGERLVSFEHFLYYFGSRELVFACELKERHIEEQALAIIRRYGAEEKITITSFVYEHLLDARMRNATIKLGYLVEKITPDVIGMALAAKIGQLCPRAGTLQPEGVRLARENGLQVRAWGVANEQIMRHALECGVDGMTINFPDKLTEVLSK